MMLIPQILAFVKFFVTLTCITTLVFPESNLRLQLQAGDRTVEPGVRVEAILVNPSMALQLDVWEVRTSCRCYVPQKRDHWKIMLTSASSSAMRSGAKGGSQLLL
ncbi:hypothetical protein BS17DRAFT_772394 [Gyrodon lividus]|nr:hypothetical protein BS17DRAFT_772394 [Gyrodon lividus]